MASCTTCQAPLIAQARFCAACGSPVVHASVVAPSARPRGIADPGPDPYGKTVRRDEHDALSEAAPAAAVSPLAASIMAAEPQAHARAVLAFARGTRVLVFWADGNRYPGTVLHVSTHHVFVAFPNGTQHWIDACYVTAEA
jgi:hypothetical protein